MKSSRLDVLSDFLDMNLNKEINIAFGHYNYDDDMFIIITGRLIIFDDKFIHIKDENGKNILISLKQVKFISEGPDMDIVRIEKTKLKP
jgi:hypothetical protein